MPGSRGCGKTCSGGFTPAIRMLQGLMLWRRKVAATSPIQVFPQPLKPGAWSFYISKHPQGKNPSPRPLGGEGGPQPALSPAGAGRVRGSHTERAQPRASRSNHQTPLSPKGARAGNAY